MKVFKPGKLGVLTRCFEHGRRFYMGVSVFSFIPMQPPGSKPKMLPEIALWKFVAERLGSDALDVGIPKSRGEFLVNGSGYAPGGVPHPAFPVRARVGPLQKDLYLYGDRYWRGQSATDAGPMTTMPIDWAHAFGGKDYTKNPLGKGDAEVDIQGVMIRPLPNVESPREQVSTPRDRPEPAGFGPLDISWPQRTSLAGTHDQHWLENLFPGFARDIDWGIHNIAARDQQREGFWAGGEPYRFDNLHPTKPALTGELPTFRARVFISRSHRAGEPRPSFVVNKETTKQPPRELDEIALALQTLWFFPDAECAVLIFQGSTFVAEEDGADVLHLLAAAEHGDRPKPVAHYLEAIAARMDPEYGLLAALREDELLPEDIDEVDSEPDEDQQLSKVEGLGQQNLHRRMVAETNEARAVIASHGLDPDEHGPPVPEPLAPPPKLQDLPAVIAKAKAEGAAKQAEIEAAHKAKQAETETMLDELGLPGFTGQTLRDEQAETKVGPPTFTAAGHIATLAKIAMDCRMQGTIIDEIEDMIVDPTLIAQWQKAEHDMRDAYRLTAHHQTPAPAMPAEMRDPTRERVRIAIANAEDFSQINLTGADLSLMNLRGADLRGAMLESANLTGADLSGAQLQRAVLAHAQLTDTRFDEAKLGEANFGKTKLERTSLIGADLDKTILAEAVMTGTLLQRARLVETMMLGAKLSKVDATGMIAEQLNTLNVVIESVDLSGATLSKTTFLNQDLRGTTFDRAVLDGCTFLACKLQKVSFFAATLDNARFVEGCELDGAVFTEASLKGANLRGSSMKGADLRKATLDDADLCECDLSDAKLYQVVARKTRFDVANLERAELMSANLMGASFTRAVIYGADLRGANLHGADMARVRTDSSVQLGEALLTKVRIHPKHVDQPEAKS